MPSFETTLGGSREGFPETAWSSLLGAPGPGVDRDAALNELATLYWRPVYKFIRTAGGATIEDAKDLTQEFFGHLIEGGVLAKYDRAKGRFRTFLKAVLRNFLSAERRDATRQKRGGGRVILPLDVAALETPDAGGRSTPEEAFDRQWVAEVLAESLAELRRQLAAEGRPVSCRVYEAYTAGGPDPGASPTYASLGRELGLSEQQVKDHLAYARARLEKIVRDRVARRVASPAEVSLELKELLFG